MQSILTVSAYTEGWIIKVVRILDMAQQIADKVRGFAALSEAEKKYDRRGRAKPVVKAKNSRKSVKKGDEYYEW